MSAKNKHFIQKLVQHTTINGTQSLPSTYGQLNNSRVPLQPPPTSKPDIIEAQESMQRQLPPSRFNNDNTNFDNMAEHYDIENASSIAPSDIDIVYHYKGECLIYKLLGTSLLNIFVSKWLVLPKIEF